MSLNKIISVVFLLFIGFQATAQRNYDGYNFLGITGGLAFFDIQTSDFITKPREGFMGGFSTRGAFRNNFDLIYGISFQNSKIAIEGISAMEPNSQDIEYTIQGVQINFLGSYNIIKNHISLEFGPVFNINGKMKLNDARFEDYILTGYTTTTAKDIQDISKFDLRLAGGITAGFKNFRLSAQYQYGVTNALGGLNDKGLEMDNFKGNSSTIVLAATFYF